MMPRSCMMVDRLSDDFHMGKSHSQDVVTKQPLSSAPTSRTTSPCSVRIHATIRSDCSPCSSPSAHMCTSPAVVDVPGATDVTMNDANVASQGRRSPSCKRTPSKCCVHATVDMRSCCHVPLASPISPSGRTASRPLASEPGQCGASGSQPMQHHTGSKQQGMLPTAVQQGLRPQLQNNAHQSFACHVLQSMHQEPCAAMLASQVWRTKRVESRHNMSTSAMRIAKRIMREVTSSSSSDDDEHLGQSPRTHTRGNVQGKQISGAVNRGRLNLGHQGSKVNGGSHASMRCAACHSPVEITIHQSPSPTQQLSHGLYQGNLSPGKRSRAERVEKSCSKLHGLKTRSKKLVHREEALAHELRGFLDACISSSSGGSGPGELSSPGQALSSGGSMSFSQGHNERCSAQQAGLPVFEETPRSMGPILVNGTLNTSTADYSERCAQNFSSPRIAAMIPTTDVQLVNSSAAAQPCFSGTRNLLPATAVTPASDAISQTESVSPVVHEHTQTAHLDSEASVQTDLSTAHFSRCRGDEGGFRLDNLSVSKATELFSRSQSPTTNAATQMLITGATDTGSGTDDPRSHLAHLSVSEAAELFTRAQSPTANVETQMSLPGHTDVNSGHGTDAVTQTELEDLLSTDQPHVRSMHSPSADAVELLQQSPDHVLPQNVPPEKHVAASQPLHSSKAVPVGEDTARNSSSQLSWSKESLAFRLSSHFPAEYVPPLGTVLSSDTIFSTTYGLDILPLSTELQNRDVPQMTDTSGPLDSPHSQVPSSHHSGPARNAPFNLPGIVVEVTGSSAKVAQNEPAASPSVTDRELATILSTEFKSAPEPENRASRSLPASETPLAEAQSAASVAQSAGSEKSSVSAHSAGINRELSLVPQFVRHLSAEQSAEPDASDVAEPASPTFLDMNPGFSSAQPDELEGGLESALDAVPRSRDSSTAASVQLQTPSPALVKSLAKQAGALWPRDKDGLPSYDRTIAGVARIKVQDPNASQHLDTNAAPDVLPHSRASLLSRSVSPLQPSAIEGLTVPESPSPSTDSETAPRSRPAPFVLPQRSLTSTSSFVRNTEAVVTLPTANMPVFESPSSSRKADAVQNLTAQSGISPVQQVLSNQSTPRKTHKVGAADAAAWVEFGRASQSVQLAKAAKGIPGSPRAQLPVTPRTAKLEFQKVAGQSTTSECSVSRQMSMQTWIVAREGADVQEHRETDDDIAKEDGCEKVFKYVVYSNSLYELDSEPIPL